jgi:hypothetical protein
MPHDEPAVHETPIQDEGVTGAAVRAPEAPGYEDEEWLDEPLELPRRPRRRFLAPVPLALVGVLLIACGFIGGVLVEKGQTSSGSSAGAAAGLASRFAALRGGSTGTGASGAAGAAGGGFAARGGGGAGAAGISGGATAGQVAYLSGSSLYVTTLEGNTVKVTSTPATSVTKTVKTSVKSIHPGETVAITGATGAGGSISAESIRVGAGGAAGLFSGSGTSRASGGAAKSGAGGASSGGGGEPALFGPGG